MAKRKEDGLVSIQVVRHFRKQDEEFTRKYCHPSMHPKDYGVVASFRFKPEFARELELKKPEAIGELVNLLRDRRMSGVFNIQKNIGSSGRPRIGESKRTAKMHRGRGPVVIIKNLKIRREEDSMEI